jgi:hypothetical protein
MMNRQDQRNTDTMLRIIPYAITAIFAVAITMPIYALFGRIDAALLAIIAQ